VPQARRAVRAGLAVGLSYHGLQKVTDDAERFREAAFKQGLPHRSVLLGDPRNDEAPGHPRNWVVGGPGRIADVFVLIAGDEPGEIAQDLARVVPGPDDGARLVFSQQAAALEGPYGRHEHFGFRDPVSQPGIRGFTPPSDPADPHQGRPGQRLVWPGEFVFGYPTQNAMDLIQPGPLAVAGPEWAVNGSFLVVRRLRQDVAAFRRFVAAAAAEIGLERERFAAQCFGRWPSGAPVTVSPERDDPILGRDESRNNHFGFATDPLGVICPQAAHIRKAYLRDHPTADVVQAGVETHRLLRRSIPYGPPYPKSCERGLLFLAYQTSFERQFEFIIRAWLNNPMLRDNEDGHDPIAGQNGRHPDRVRRFRIPLPGSTGETRAAVLTLNEEWVTPTGGGYFFVPSISALRLLGAY
jgi:Dyp-type peroxidase family